MFHSIGAVLIWSEDYRTLANWYIEKLALNPVGELNHPKDIGISFKVGGTILWIGKHSKVKGKNKDMHRIMFNLSVDSVSEAYAALKDRGVIFFAEPFKAPTFDKYFATFYDGDDNLVQLIGEK